MSLHGCCSMLFSIKITWKAWNTDEDSAPQETHKNVKDGIISYTNADVVVKLQGWDPAYAKSVAQACLSALKQLIQSDKKLPGNCLVGSMLSCWFNPFISRFISVIKIFRVDGHFNISDLWTATPDNCFSSRLGCYFMGIKWEGLKWGVHQVNEYSYLEGSKKKMEVKNDWGGILQVERWNFRLKMGKLEHFILAHDWLHLCHLSGKKSLYIRLGCRGDWPNIKPPGWDPSSEDNTTLGTQ